MLSKILNEAESSRLQVHFAAYGGPVYHVSEGGRSAAAQEFQLNIIALLEF